MWWRALNPLAWKTAGVAAAIALATGLALGAWLANTTNAIAVAGLETKLARAATQAANYETAVATARADGLAAGQRLAAQAAQRAQEAANARAAELAAIATRADRQLTGVLRLCGAAGQPVPATGARRGADAGDQSAATAGLVPGRVDGDRAVFDPTVIRQRLNRAEQIAADLRTCMAAWPQ